MSPIFFQRLDIQVEKEYTVVCKGVLTRGLRGGCIPSTSPDLDHANVGMQTECSDFGGLAEDTAMAVFPPVRNDTS